MSKYADELRISQGSWKQCTMCGWAVKNTNGGTRKMREHFQKEHSDLKRSE